VHAYSVIVDLCQQIALTQVQILKLDACAVSASSTPRGMIGACLTT